MELTTILGVLVQARPALTRLGVSEIGVFGSAARGEATPSSDVDILLELRPECVTFDNYMDLKFLLEDLLGCSVDVVLKSGIKPSMKEQILSEVVYAA